ncbi:helicase and polymerase-containing protein TEBICHI isoform X1 [Typha latifolia]|uniref:helicase and polymerase-containing protein TEBICHI isoform X1 n=1 Tax=Typha latifolia TaxID=4733 RepID=UPI003C2EB9CC
MASGSPRARIDQFFASRKRKPPLLKDEKHEEHPKSPNAASPSAKGTLDNFLVKSPDAAPCADRDESSNHEAVRRGLNLSNEIGSVSDVAPEPAVRACSLGSETIGGNLELKRFATDFLSLYCSDLPSAVNPHEEHEVKGQKRNGSPSLLAACDKTSGKKQCVVDVKPEFKPEAVGDAIGAGTSGRHVTANEPTCDGFLSLRRCSNTPSSSVMKTGVCIPDLSVCAVVSSETPRSAFRNLVISPGEEFWNAAIQVADGIFAPVEKVQGSLCLLKTGNSCTKLQEEKSSCEDSQCAKSFPGPGIDDLDGQNMVASNCVKPTEELAEGRKIMLNEEASPLPVKHLDFSHEEDSSCNCISRKDEGRTRVASSVECADKGSSKVKSLQGSEDLTNCIDKIKSSILSGKPKSSVDVLDKDSCSSVGNWCHSENGTALAVSQGEDSLPNQANDSGSGLVKHEKKGGLLAQGNAIKFNHNEGSLCVGLQNHVCNTANTGKEIDSKSTSQGAEAGTPTSFMPLKNQLKLTSWLPLELCSIYMKKGILELYPWQVECLLVEGVLEKRNLVYCASTSAGKSFVAEILMLRRIISTGKMALLVLPYVSICAEKAEHLELLLEPLGKHVRSFYGNQGGGSLPKDTSVAVCTIEKANSLVNRLLEDGRLSELGIIVIDELHMVGDQHRGYLLELLLTKLRYAAGEGNSESSSGESSGSSSGKANATHGLQIVGMSATMPNVAAVADWLRAALYQTDFRPVPLEEYIKVGDTIFDKKMNVIRKITKAADLGGKDPDHIVELCNEVVIKGHSVLIFCSSRKGCESTARHISRFLQKFSVRTSGLGSEFSDVSSAVEALRRCPAGLDLILEQTLPSGVAYHHAGLTVEEREIIETCYRKGLVRVLTATSTLAAGVNLPARRVIFRQPRVGRDFIDGTRYKQMSGRAGRTGIDTRGESILICKPDEVKRIVGILNSSCPPLQSCLSEDKNGMTHAIMEVVAGGIVQTASDIHRYVRCTLLNSIKPFQDVVKSAQDSLRWLCHQKFLKWNEEAKLYNVTPLGHAAFGSSLTPEESLIVLDDLSRAREGFVLASDLHLVYLVTPINVEVEPDWELYYERFMELSILDQSVGNRIGVMEPFLMHMAHGVPLPVQGKLQRKSSGLHNRLQTQSVAISNGAIFNDQALRVSKRFYVALMLSRLVQEVPIADVCEAFKVARGMIQALQENAGRFAMMVSVFCERLGWHDLEGLVAKFQNRVSFGVRAEIVELTTIPFVKGSRARALYKAGLRTPSAIAEAPVPEIAKALFESSAWSGQDDSSLQRMRLGIAKKIKNGACKIVLDQAEEARVAAISAFKSLGIHVPQFSQPLLSKVKDSLTERNTFVPEEDGAEKSFQPSALTRTEDRITNCGGTSGKACGEKLPEDDLIFESSREVKSSGVKPCKFNITNAAGITPGTSCFPKLTAHDRNGKVDIVNDASPSIRSVTDKGPINACNFPGGFDPFLDQWCAVSEFSFDVHFLKRSDLQSPVLFEVIGLAICWENSPVYYCNLSKDLMSTEKLSTCDMWEVAKTRWRRIAGIMRQNGVRKITWNLKVQIQALKYPCISIQKFGRLGLEHKKLNDFVLVDSSYILLPSIPVHNVMDICLAVWVLWPDEESKTTPNLDKVVKKRLSSEAAAAANRDGRWRNQMHKAAHNGCCRRVAQTRALGSVLGKILVSENLTEVVSKIESPLVNVLADMELWGIGVDMEACLRARHLLIRKLRELEKEAYTLAGRPFSLYTTADIANVLYNYLKLPVPQGCDKGKLHPSTDKHSLDLLRGQHPIIAVIKEHRTLAKLLNSTLGSICSRARLCVKSQKYTIQGHWLQTSTATGRLSVEEPNLQCVEHLVIFTTGGTDKDASSSSSVEHHQINARDFFLPTQDNWLMITADYSQIELRLMAHFSKDSELIELLSNPDGDVFTLIAARWTGKMESIISSQERDHTKRLIYGILYGMGANSLAEQLECSSEEAVEKIQSFKTLFPAVSSWLREAVESCRHKGYVETLMGRKRFLPKIQFGNSKEKAKAQRQAVNSICQGSAADIIKMAMITVHSVIVDNSEPVQHIELARKFSAVRGRCRIILQVHDELVLETDPCVVPEAAKLLQISMERATSLLVPLHVKLKVGKSWGSLEAFQPEP